MVRTACALVLAGTGCSGSSGLHSPGKDGAIEVAGAGGTGMDSGRSSVNEASDMRPDIALGSGGTGGPVSSDAQESESGTIGRAPSLLPIPERMNADA